MNHHNVRGLAVFSIADGEKLGTVARAYLDPDTKQIVGFAVKAGGLLQPDWTPLIAATAVTALGPDALLLEDKTAVGGTKTWAGRDALVDLADLAKRTVVTEGGTEVGRVAVVEFDERTLQLTRLVASPGFSQRRKIVPADRVLRVEARTVVVAEAQYAETAGGAPWLVRHEPPLPAGTRHRIGAGSGAPAEEGSAITPFDAAPASGGDATRPPAPPDAEPIPQPPVASDGGKAADAARTDVIPGEAASTASRPVRGHGSAVPTAAEHRVARSHDAPAMGNGHGRVAGDGTRDCPSGFPVKGNASSKIYHEPGRRSYDTTIPEFCFASAGDAEAEGYRPPKR